MDENKKEQELQLEYTALERLIVQEDLSEKKARIFSRLLMDAGIAKQMETLAQRHEQRKKLLCALVGKKEGEEKI